MTTGEILSVVGIVLSTIAILVAIGFNVYLINRNKNLDIEKYEARLTALETKVGLFWGLVENNMSKFLLNANPIQFDADEQAAARLYDLAKSETPTYALRKLEDALNRELKDKKEELPRDEMFALTLILSAIKAQLVDRGEKVYK